MIWTENWTATWGAAPAFAVGPHLNAQTIRQFARVSLGGSFVRVRLSNETGTLPVTLGPVRLALAINGRVIDTATSRPVVFSGKDVVTLRAGMVAVSDPVDLPIPAGALVGVSFFTPRMTPPAVIHGDGGQTTYVSPSGLNCIDAETMQDAVCVPQRFYLTRIEVAGPSEGSVVALGDSITDGGSAGIDTDARWPDHLARRLAASGRSVGVVNAGISGNRILHDEPELGFGPAALARLDRDVLGVAGVRWLVVTQGINDIGHATHAGLSDQAVSADDVIAGLTQIIVRAKAASLKVFGGTLTPFEGEGIPRFYTTEGETTRQRVNAWIRESGAFDGHADFDAALRDPVYPTRMIRAYNCGDSLHPNAAGYAAMAAAVNLDWFR